MIQRSNGEASSGGRVFACVCVRICVHLHAHVCMVARLRACSCVRMCVRVCMRMSVCMTMSVCMCADSVRVCAHVHACLCAHVCLRAAPTWCCGAPGGRCPGASSPGVRCCVAARHAASPGSRCAGGPLSRPGGRHARSETALP